MKAGGRERERERERERGEEQREAERQSEGRFDREQYKGTLSLVFMSNIWLSSGTLPVV